MNRALLTGIFLMFAAKVFSNPWNDDFTYAFSADNRNGSYCHADIRSQLTFSEESSLFKGGEMRNFYEPSKILLLFSGIAGIVIAGRHIRKP